METDEAVKTGYLTVPGQGFLKKYWNKRFYALHRASNHGIQRLEVFDNEENSLRQSPVKIIPLTDCVKVNSTLLKHQNNVFEIRTKEHVHMFSADSYQEMTDWLTSIQTVAFGNGIKLGCSGLSQPIEAPILSPPINTHHEENLIYSSVDAPEVYPVGVMESEATTRCKLQGSYQLTVTSVGITLTEACPLSKNKVALMWSYRHIRRYGYSHTTFSFEAGRKAASGEGLFTFNTKDGATIFQSIAARVDSLKTSKNDPELCNTPSPVADKGFFNSPEISNKSAHAKQVNEQRYGVINSTAPVAKPPRRSKIKLDRLPPLPPNSDNTYEDTALSVKNVEAVYDEPEARQEAWKTHGKDFESDSSADPTYEDLSYASVQTEKIIDLHRLSLSNENEGLSNSLPRTRNSFAPLYGKVNITRNVNLSSKGPDYENLLVSNQGNGSPPSRINLDDGGESPQRIVCNDVEYAQIIRKKK